MKYYVAGRPKYESTGHTNEKLAARVLRDRMVKVDRGEPIIARLDRITYAEAAKDLGEHYTSSGASDIEDAGWRSAHLDTFFAHYRLAAIGRRHALHREAARGVFERHQYEAVRQQLP
jgi:hypothetical protein